MGYADTNSYSKKITSASTDTQVFKSPWLIGRSYFPTKMIITNEGAAAIVKIYDGDLTVGSIAPDVGDSANSPIFEFNMANLETKIIDNKSLPLKRFISGMVANSNIANVVITVEIKED